MTWARKVMLYLWGCLLGTIILFFSWKYFKPDVPIPSWLPTSVIMDRINRHPLQKTEKAVCLLNCYKINETEVMNVLAQKDIDYSSSEKTKKPWPIYYFSGKTTTNQMLYLKIEVQDSLASTIVDIKMDSIACPCTQ